MDRDTDAYPNFYKKELKEDPKALQTLVDRFDSEIRYCDFYVKELFDILAPHKNTLIIITSDHGEAFLEHDQLLHGQTLFEEEIRIPLIIKFPIKKIVTIIITIIIEMGIINFSSIFT